MVCDSLQEIKIVKCPKLKRLPLSLRDEQLSSPPSSLRIITEKEWWELLEWDNHATKNALEPLCEFVVVYTNEYDSFHFYIFGLSFMRAIQFIPYLLIILLAFFLISFPFMPH